MLRWIVGLWLLFNMAYADEKYFIQLGSFKQLDSLEKSLNQMPYDLLSHVVIVRSNNWYIPFAYYTTQKSLLQSKLSSYRRYFRDAKIESSDYMIQHPLVRSYVPASPVQQPMTRPTITPPPVRSQKTAPIQVQRPALVQRPELLYQNVAISEEDNILHLDSTPVAKPSEPNTMQRIVHTRYKDFSKQMVSGKYYYLAYKSTKESPNLLIKVTFGNHTVNYQPIIGDMKMTEAHYLIRNKRLYMFADTFTEDGTYSTLDEHRKDHFLVSSWVNGKKMNTLRYYYRLNDAKEYLGINSSTGLANTLEEGTFDRHFIED